MNRNPSPDSTENSTRLSDRDTPNIFIVDKGHEHDIVMRLRMALWDFCVIGAIYLAASLWLVQAAWPWLRSG